MTRADELTDGELAELERLADEGEGEPIGVIASAWLDRADNDQSKGGRL